MRSAPACDKVARVSVFDRLTARGRASYEAKQAESVGDLARAAELFSAAGLADEVARIMLLRGDVETSRALRLQHYAQAAATAPEGHAVQRAARLKHATFVLACTGAAAASSGARADVQAAARELELAGEPALAAEAYARIGDAEGQAHALELAGDVEGLERLLAAQEQGRRLAREREAAHVEVELRVATGKRREALAFAVAESRARPDDLAMHERIADIERRRVRGPIATATFGGERVCLVLGDVLTIGRTEGAITVASQAMSRAHLRLERIGGVAHVRDLGSRNGTRLRGVALAGAIRADEPMELILGGQVRVVLAPSTVLPGALRIEVGESVYIASIGEARIPNTPWRLGLAGDDWVELSTADGTPALLGASEVASPVTLLAGDTFHLDRGGAAVLALVGQT